jgi:hydrogenase maturation protease
MQTECLIQQNPQTSLEVKVRFLHLLMREVGRRIADCRLPIAECGHFQVGISDSHFALVPAMEVNGQLFQAWQEAIERDVCLPSFKLSPAGTEPQSLNFSFPSSEQVEPLRDENSGEILGVIMRRQQAIEGVIEVERLDCGVCRDESLEGGFNSQSVIRNPQSEGLSKISVRILNLTLFADAEHQSRDEALMRSFVSTHTILSAQYGEFVSLLDPPEELRQAAAGCSNIGTYPVLAGDEGTQDCMLSSPIILYDYPQIAPESAGNLFDGTEIDEILTLRIMTLTEDEKREMRGADDRARQLLERTETLPAEQLMKMHGAMKGVKR